jgi:hypothetical protein
MVIVVVAALVADSGYAQFSGYASAGYAYHSNPLYNFETIHDRLLQGYWQLDCLMPSPQADWKFGYVGGLMLFQNLAARNYYEHRLSASLLRRFLSSDGKEEGEEEDAPFRRIELGARVEARHDRAEYRQFDNWGAGVSGTYTVGSGKLSAIALSNETGIRRYAQVHELDNITSVVGLRLTGGATEAARYTLFGGAGVKHYVTSDVDTSVFVTAGSSSSNGQGKGKGKGLLSGTGNGKKDILVNASSVNTLQLHAGVGAAWQWEGGSAQSEFLYRIDPGSSTRVLAQYTNSTMLSEDLYNDFFSHAGPEFKLALRQQLPLGISLSLDVAAQRRKYLSPAFTLEGIQTADTRVDLHGGVDLSFSRSIALGEASALEVGVSGGALRNKSNDAYNDFSVQHYNVTVGMGF